MPSLSSTLTLTTTFLLTVTSTALPKEENLLAIPDAIAGLSDCAQGILFPLIADSQTNPADFPSICAELARLNARQTIDFTCTKNEAARKYFTRDSPLPTNHR
ncbi:hypothetical protein CC80DRAFT_494408 [Byssothecium circinans]|uniref:Uncharacterized protein n=1 Tax=Byssothecium circinans TaxID=147558 RepID=A0A6A5TLD7_9PLEO|nr:hypothetical protein CC80DRAFT_494408 [Byssothecium circinans]